MRVIVAGLGVQGYKRRMYAGDDYVASVDPLNEEADYKALEDVPLMEYDAAMLCVPDGPKIDLLNYLIENGKHALVEKPLWAARDDEIIALETRARAKGVICYTAYNHRFEPHFVQMRDVLKSGVLGEIYRCRMFYGNGTAQLVRQSQWRDEGGGVLPDLGSHLLDTAAFWFGDIGDGFQVISSNCFENRAPDHVVIGSMTSRPRLQLEMTLLMWRNHFTCDILAENGSVHIESLCKWGPSTFTHRKRVRPSGRPLERVDTLEQSDPTWAEEYKFFRRLCEQGGETDLTHDLWLQRTLRELTEVTVAEISC